MWTHLHAVISTVLCLAVVLWSTMPAYTHAPVVFETIHEHIEMIEDHDHSHGFEEDLYLAIHGHGHDVADHDHSQAYLLPAAHTAPDTAFVEMRVRIAPSHGPTRHFRIDRPPRV